MESLLVTIIFYRFQFKETYKSDPEIAEYLTFSEPAFAVGPADTAEPRYKAMRPNVEMYMMMILKFRYSEKDIEVIQIASVR